MIFVLYVDDERDLLEIAQLFLEQTGEFRVATSTSAQEALDSPSIQCYDVIVSDYQMPGMDGIAFLKAVRERFGDIPFILFTGRGREEVVIEAINNGADFYLQKGGDPTAQFAELDHDIRVAVERRKAVDALMESEQRLADIINFLPDATFAIDIKGVVIAWNRAIEVMTGIPAADMLGKGDHEYAIPFYGERRPILIDLVLETEEKIGKRDYTITKKEGNVLIAETAAARPRGVPKILSGKASLLYNKKGDIAGAIESIRDITETRKGEEELRAAYEQITAAEEELRGQYDVLRKNEEALRESEKAYRTIFEHTGSATIQVEEDTTIAMVNNTFEKLTGYCRQEIEGIRKWTEFVVKEDLDRMKRFHQDRRTPEGRPPEQYEFRLITKQGEFRDILLTVGIIPGTKKTVATLFDLTDRKKMELALRESEAKFRTLAETSIVSICVFGQKILYVNPAGEALTGYSRDELLKMDFWSFIHPDFRDLVRDRGLRRQKGEIVPSHYEVKIVRKDGGERWVDASTTAFRFEGQPTLLSIQVDITERKIAEAALQQASLVVENSPVVLFRWKAAEGWPVAYVSNNVSQFGYIPEEFLSGTVSFSSIVHSGDLERVSAEVQENSASGVGQFTQEYRIVTKDGNIRWVDDRTVIERDSDGRITHFQGIVIDITKRKQAESELRAAYEQLTATEEELRRQYREMAKNAHELRQSETRYRNVVEVQTELISRFHPDGTHVFVNEAYCRYFGKSREEIIGHTFIPDIPVEDRENVKLHFASLTPSHSVDSVEHRIIMPGGEIRWQRWNDRAIFDEKGNVTEFQSVGRDITDRRQVEEALRESEEKYRSILDQIQDVFYRTDMQGILTMMSPAGARILGYDSPDEVRGLDIARDLYADPEKRKEFLSVLAENGTVDNFPITIKLRDGSHRYATVSSHFYYRADGTPQGIEGIIHDITDIRLAEDALRQANRQLNLMTNITRHDILNKVTIILGYLSLAKKKVAAPVMTQFIDNLELETKAIRSQIEFTRVYQDLGIHEPHWQELDTVIPRLHIPADIALAAGVQGMVVFADPMLEKVFSNLLDNSVRHGQRVTEIRVSSHQSGEDLVVVWEDNGIGIAAEEKERIFERGFGKNTGLGMFLVREILSLTGITIKETGVPGKGARFKITVPKEAYRILAGR